jgi:hypothetical protein
MKKAMLLTIKPASSTAFVNPIALVPKIGMNGNDTAFIIAGYNGKKAHPL